MLPQFHPVVHGLTVRRAPRQNLRSSFNKHKYLLSSLFQVLQEERGEPRSAGPAIALRVVHAHSQVDIVSDDSETDFVASSVMGELGGGEEGPEPRPFALVVLDALPPIGPAGRVARQMFRLAPLSNAATASFSSQELIDHSIVHLVLAPFPSEQTVLVFSGNASDHWIAHKGLAGRWQSVTEECLVNYLPGDGRAWNGPAKSQLSERSDWVPPKVITTIDEVEIRFDSIVVRAALRELQKHEAIESDYRSIWL